MWVIGIILELCMLSRETEVQIWPQVWPNKRPLIGTVRFDPTRGLWFTRLIKDKTNIKYKSFRRLWCLMPITTIVELYRSRHFYRWGKPEYQEKSTDKLYHIMLCSVYLAMSEIQTHNCGDKHWLHRKL